MILLYNDTVNVVPYPGLLFTGNTSHVNIYNKTNHRKSKSKAFPGTPAFINSIKTIPYFVKMFFFDTDSIIFDDDISVFLVSL